MLSTIQFLAVTIVLSLFPIHSGKRTDLPSLAKGILDSLYYSFGDFQYDSRKPTIEIVPGESFVAQYDPSNQVIRIEEKAIDICRSMGPDSIDALAYLISHELRHFYQEEFRESRRETNFLKSDKHYYSSIQLEKEADIQGIFLCFLVGYPVKRVIPNFLDRVYNAYQLSVNEPKGYPSLNERKQSATESLKQSEELFELFQASTLMAAMGDHEIAINGFDHILEYYKGYEIWNNLGLSKFLKAINQGQNTREPYVYPIELSWESRLSKGLDVGTKELDFDALSTIQSAKKDFLQAIHMNPRYIPSHINMLSAYAILGETQFGKDHIKQYNLHEVIQGEKSKLTYQLHFAVTMIDLKADKQTGISGLLKLKNSTDPSIRKAVDHNLEMAQLGRNEQNNIIVRKKPKSVDCPILKKPNLSNGQETWERRLSSKWIAKCFKSQKAIFYVFESETQKVELICEIQPSQNQMELFESVREQTSILSTSRQILHVLLECKISWLMDSEERIIEYGYVVEPN